MAGGGEPFRLFPHGVLLDECSAGLCPERLEHELSTLFLMICKRITRLRTEKPLTDALRAASSIAVAQADRILCRMTDRYFYWSTRQAHLQFRLVSPLLSICREGCAGRSEQHIRVVGAASSTRLASHLPSSNYTVSRL